MPTDPDHDSAYQPLIDQALAARGWLISLPGVLRPRYNAEQHAARCPNNRLVVLVMTIIFDMFLFSQFHTAPEILRASAILRGFVVTPAVLLFVLADDRGLLKRAYGVCLVTVAVLPTLISTILILMTNAGNSNAMADIHATPLILLATGVVTRLTPREVFSNVALSTLAFMVAIFFAPCIPPPQQSSLLLSEIAVGAAAMIYNLQLESRDRRLFLLRTSEAIARAALAARNRGLLAQTQTDGLTGVANRRCFDDTLREAWAQALQTGAPLGLIILDIDHFKSFNDFYGHQGGDDCLRLVAGQARREVRASDLFARYGGEEFAAILPGATLDTAIEIAERIRAAVFNLAQRHDGQDKNARVTVSLGAAAMHPAAQEDPRCLIELADANLYAAKRAGRNRVCAQPAAAPAPPRAMPMTARLLDFKRSPP
jgi:diguanylate cyclase (GGDEF)-like protein